MPRHVALLQGINVGKNRRIRMEDLRTLVADLGHTDVRTHLNSGNVVFTEDERNNAKLAREIEAAIAAELGMEVPVIVRSGDELQAIVANNPFPGAAADHKTLHVAFLREAPDADAVAALADLDRGEDDYRVIGPDMYLYYPNKTTGAVFIPKGLGVSTSRNWRTVTKLAGMTSSS